VGKALTTLGDPRGVPMLIHVLAGGTGRFGRPRFSGWGRSEAARLLDDISGKNLPVARRTYSGDELSEQSEKELRDAADTYRAWWDEVRDRIVFDRVAMRWVLE
jgi:hypothetical protein